MTRWENAAPTIMDFATLNGLAVNHQHVTEWLASLKRLTFRESFRTSYRQSDSLKAGEDSSVPSAFVILVVLGRLTHAVSSIDRTTRALKGLTSFGRVPSLWRCIHVDLQETECCPASQLHAC